MLILSTFKHVLFCNGRIAMSVKASRLSKIGSQQPMGSIHFVRMASAGNQSLEGIEFG